jgi:hypothetical protein
VPVKERVSFYQKCLESFKLFRHKGDLQDSDLEDEVPKKVTILEPYPYEEFTRSTSIGIVTNAYQRYDAEAVVRLILDLPPFHEYFSVLPYNSEDKDYIRWFVNAQRARYESKRDNMKILVNMTVKERDTAAELFESLYTGMMDQLICKQGPKEVDYDKVYKRRMMPTFSEYLKENVFENAIESSLEWVGVEEKVQNQEK